MNWKEWTKFPDIEGEKVRALRALVFREVLQKKEIKSSWSIPPIKVSTLITARSVLFFVYNDNKPTTWNALETYLTEKYGYSTGTVYGQHQHLLSYLIESTGDKFKLRDEIYDEALRILEDDEYAEKVIEEAEELEWTVKAQFYRRYQDFEESSSENENEISAELVLKDGSRVRIVLEVQLVVKGVRFEVV